MYSEKVHIMNHPLVAHKLTIMRDKNTSVKDFRELVSEIGMLITYEATRDLPLTTKHIETPICGMDAPTLAGRKFVVVPILRAGLGLVDGVLRMVPSARVGHIGMYRDEETLEPHPYFCKMPKDVAERDVLIVDPMLATGGSAAEAIGEMKKRGCKHIKLMVLGAAPEGIAPPSGGALFLSYWARETLDEGQLGPAALSFLLYFFVFCGIIPENGNDTQKGIHYGT